MEIHDHHLPIHYKAFMEYDNNLIKVIKDVFSWSWASHYHLSVCNEVYCGKSIHPTAKISEQVNRKCSPRNTFNHLHCPKLPTRVFQSYLFVVLMTWIWLSGVDENLITPNLTVWSETSYNVHHAVQSATSATAELLVIQASLPLDIFWWKTLLEQDNALQNSYISGLWCPRVLEGIVFNIYHYIYLFIYYNTQCNRPW